MKKMLLLLVIGSISFAAYQAKSYTGEYKVVSVSNGAVQVISLTTGDLIDIADESLVNKALQGKIVKDQVIEYNPKETW